ncbi:DUF1834 family protein [Shigella sonnei]|uniref:DUF1834 family protein n=1 Tax=Plesiomonas shigelloides TaxID=703 RepID=UPI0012615763|nr:DUF1834 family protein [Plesiomonas shigelloides]EEZ5537909.1 DUF1834 family protein [Escherichia coli]EFV5694745.1 DUF1834 family protein [Shigella sonnei]EEZ5551881.1 DUF1834 family protein [Escherichia coli]EFX1701614.1 DUF1834 family protein [Shigella sonnei]EFX1719077.1 DUF1834 family protein [Shigella sonnei]
MITEIENAVIDRLKAGMGRMVRDVVSYGGELDDIGEIVRALPAAWVTFGGITHTKAVSTSNKRFRTHGRFVVMVGDYNARCEVAGRQGGVRIDEVGCYRMIYAVRRLLMMQSLGLDITPFQPGKVRTLFNTRMNEKALSVFAIEFDTSWIEAPLALGAWPMREDCATEPDHIFTRYRGKLAEPDAPISRIGLSYDPPGIGSREHPADLINLDEDISDES